MQTPNANRTRPLLLRADMDYHVDDDGHITVTSTPDGSVLIDMRGVLYGDDTQRACVALARAVEHTHVRRVVMTINSPGGDVEGVRELHHALVRINAPRIALIRGECCSASYWIASSADTILATIGSTIGSIGAYLVVCSMSCDDVRVFRSSPVKGIGIDGISDAQASAYQAYVNSVGDAFVSDIRARRPMISDDALTGGFWLASDAQRLALIDDIIV